MFAIVKSSPYGTISFNLKKAAINTDMTKTSFIYVGAEPEAEAKKCYAPVVDVSSSTFKVIDTVFKVFVKNERNRFVPVKPLPEHLVSKYFPEEFMLMIVNASNKYRDGRMKNEPDLAQWRQKRDERTFIFKGNECSVTEF